jgi:hypothetical protein
MKMSDKDFDQLFNTKLADMEMEPSANVWGNIAAGIDGKQDRKKAGVPFMRIAATIIVLMGVGLFFLRPENQVVQLHALASAPVETDHTVQVTSPTTEEPVILPQADLPAQTSAGVKHQQNGTSGYVPKINNLVASGLDSSETVPNRIASENIKPLTNESVKNDQTTPIVAAVQQKGNTVITEEKGSITTVNNTQDAKNADAAVTNPAIAANTTGQKITSPSKKKKIRSLDDLLNVVIAKVDKRENKIIVFGSNDDDDNKDIVNVTSVNLGPIKVKKQN